MEFTLPSHDDSDWRDLPLVARKQVSDWLHAFGQITCWKPVGRAIEQVAHALGCSTKTARRKYDDYRHGNDWWGLLDKRLAPEPDAANPIRSHAFLDYFQRLCEESQRCTAAAIRELHRRWRSRQSIPGYEELPGWPDLPPSWSRRNLYRCASDPMALVAKRIGIKAARKYLPQVFTTRVGCYPGSHYFFDDVWHDNYVRIGRQHVTRVLELGVLDFFSGSRFHFGCKPRMPREDGTGRHHLAGREMRWFLAEVLMRYGVSRRGTTLYFEHGTANIDARTERILFTAFGEMVKIRRSGIEGDRQAVLGFWGGVGSGNPRTKAPLESLHNLIHNELGFLLGQTGKDRQHAPEITGVPTLASRSEAAHHVAARLETFLKSGHRLPVAPYQQALLEFAAKLPEERAALLLHPLPEFHSQFYPLLLALYDQIDSDTGHQLKDWAQLGFQPLELFDPEAGKWLLEEAVHRLPGPRAARVLAAARTNPRAFARPRQLSRKEVWQTRSDMIHLPLHSALDLIGKDLARVERVRGSYFEFEDSSISSKPLRYRAEVTTPDGTVRQLPAGERYPVFCNPYQPETLAVCDTSYRLLGIARRDHDVPRLDEEALVDAFRKRAAWTAERLAPLRARHAEAAEATQALTRHNRHALAGDPVTPEEKAAAASQSARQAVRTRKEEEIAKALGQVALDPESLLSVTESPPVVLPPEDGFHSLDPSNLL